jgi:hypothetical protein
MWVQHRKRIFVSSDESRTFTEINGVAPAMFGFAVHPRQSRYGVVYSQDQG